MIKKLLISAIGTVFSIVGLIGIILSNTLSCILFFVIEIIQDCLQF